MQLGFILGDLRKYCQAVSARDIQRKFFDAQTAAKRSITYAFLIATLAIVFFGVEFVIEKFIYANDEVVDIISAVIGAFVFSKFQNFFETLTDRIFFRGQYNYADAVKKLNGVLSETIDLKDLLRAIANFLATTIKPESVVFFFDDAAGHVVVFENPAGARTRGKPALKKGYRAIAKQCQASSPRLLIVDDAQHEKDGANHRAMIQTIARKSRVAAIVPFLSKDGAVATMLVGEKLSGKRLRANDKELLLAISHQAGMAIENARLYEALRRHSEDLEKRVEQKTERIRQMSDAQSKFLADVAHEFQTPIAILKGNIGALAKDKNVNRTSGRANAIYVATTTLDRLSRLVTNLLDIAKLNFSKEKFQKRPIEARRLLEETRDDCIILAEDKDISLSIASDYIFVCGDKDKLKEVLLNLVSNALKHTPAGGAITIEARRSGDAARISVRDTGKGIAAENLPRIFDRFYKIDQRGGVSGAGTGDAEGNGIGLHLCRQIVETHGGTIVAESEPGKGSCFVIHLPLAPPLSLRQKPEDPAESRPGKNVGKTAIINE